MGVKFNCTDVYGKQIEVVTKTSDMLVSILKSSSATAEKKELATKLLDYISQQDSRCGSTPTFHNSTRPVAEC